MPALLAVLAVLCGACSERTLLTQEDYRPSLAAHAAGDDALALARFPSGEAGAFITTMERTLLNLLQGRPEIDDLARYRDLLADRYRYEVSREVLSFFFVVTPEGYYASEHELIWMHLLLSWGYSLRGQAQAACVEARQAGHLLSARWSEEGHFDDPTLRAIAGVMWAWCGSWEDAAVDFRVAWQLDESLDWALALSRREQPPRELILVLGGPGPTPVWEPEMDLNPLRGVRNIAFRLHGLRSTAGLEGPTQVVDLHLTPSAAPWYERHLLRENAVHELIGDSSYGLDSTYELGLHATKVAGVTAYWASATVVDTVAGAGEVNPLDAYDNGREEFERSVDESERHLQRQIDPTPFYRFVRFLPEYAWVGWSDERLRQPLWFTRMDGMESEVLSRVPAVGGRAPRVFLGALPDVR